MKKVGSILLIFCTVFFLFGFVFAYEPYCPCPDCETHTIRQVLDDSGRQFRPGDFLEFQLSGQELVHVSMDCRGYRGARATLYVDGVYYGSKSLSSYRAQYTWDIRAKNAYRAVVKFSSVDPIVYSTTIRYRAPKRIEIRTVVRTVTVEIPKQFIYNELQCLRPMLDTLFDKNIGTRYEAFLDQAVFLAEEAEAMAGKSLDSDGSHIAQKMTIDLIMLVGCEQGLSALRDISRIRREDRDLVRRIKHSVNVLREITDYFDLKTPSGWWLNEKVDIGPSDIGDEEAVPERQPDTPQQSS